MLLLTFKGVNNLIPAYLSDFLIKYVSGRENLRSGNEHLLCVSRTKRAIGDCSFCVAGPRLWNSLPSHIRFSPSVSVFKKSLKGCGMGPWLVLVSPCFSESVVGTCKLGLFFVCILDNLLQKNVIVFLFFVLFCFVLFFFKSNFKMALI